MKSLCTLILAFWVCSLPVYAETPDSSESGLTLPRMAALRSNNINGRSGPDTKYPIEWIYRQKGAPVEIINEFGLWRKIKDWEGSETWVHKSMLTGRRFVRVMTPGENNVYNRPDYKSKIIAKVEDGVIGEVKKCTRNAPFCLIRFDGAEGWLPRNILFGIYDTDNIS